jgi:AraC family transcriptional regulator
MEPKIVKKPEMILVGVVDCAPDVGQMDIHALWERFTRHDPHIQHQIEGTGYELHIQEEHTPPMHFCLTGVEVREIENLPLECFAKVIPPCKYAVFTHAFSQGGYGAAYQAVSDWLQESGTKTSHPFDLQCYDARFKGLEDPDSVFEILVPIT